MPLRPLRGSGFTSDVIDAQEGQSKRANLLDSTATDSVRILGIRSVLSGPAGTAVEVAYLADREMGPDAHAVLIRLLAGRTRISEDRLSLCWVPAAVRVRVSRTGGITPADEPALLELRGLLVEWPGLQPTLAVAPGLPKRAAEAARTEIQKQLMVADLPLESAPEDLDARTVLVRIAAPD